MYASLDHAFGFPFNDIKSLAPVQNERSCTNMIHHLRSCTDCQQKLAHYVDTEFTEKPHHYMKPEWTPKSQMLPFGLNKRKLIKLLIAILIIIIIVPLIMKSATGNLSLLS